MIPRRVIASPSAARSCQQPSCPGLCHGKRSSSFLPRRPGAGGGKDAGPFPPLLPPVSGSSLKSQVAPTLNPRWSWRIPSCRSQCTEEVDGGEELRVGAFSARFPHLGNRLALFFLRTPRRRTASLKESGVSCVPHGAWGKEMIKAVRFPGSSRCLRWVLIWEQSEERLRPFPIYQHPASAWIADDLWGRVGTRASMYTFQWVQDHVLCVVACSQETEYIRVS